VRRFALLRRFAIWLPALGLVALLLIPAPGWGETLKVSQPDQQLYAKPDFASSALGPMAVGSEVNVLEKSGDWYKVEYQGKSGYMHRLAFPQAQAPSKFGLPGLLFGGPVKESKTDEVALAGKGFTPEVESSYKQKHPEMKFAQVDQVEAIKVDAALIQGFIQEGGLTP
jgi:uncharacterized protein YgiM (DUF1202 family)